MAINTAQFNTLVNGLGNLVTALNGQGRGEAKFAKIIDFYGDTQDPIGWLQDFESASQANNISAARKRQIVGAYLKGAAGTWLASKRVTNANWPTQWDPTDITQQNDQLASFTYQFKQKFRTVDKIYEWQQQLNQRKQLPTETVEQYSAAVRELLRRIDPDNAYPEHLKVMMFIEGLRPEIKFFVNPTRPANLDNAIHTAQLYGSSYQQFTGPSVTTATPTATSLLNIPILQQPVNNDLAQFSQQLEALTTKLDKLSISKNQNQSYQNNRYNNNNNRNYSNNQRRNNYNNNNQPLTCYNCGKIGHMAAQCFSKRNNNYNNNQRQNNNNNYQNRNLNNNRQNNNNNWNKNNNNNQNNNQQKVFLNTEQDLNS